MSQAQSPSPVWRRHVFFLSGFDPKGAAHYHRLYRTHAELQGDVTGDAYEVGERKTCPSGNATWTVRSGQTETVYEYVRWDDIVRAQWPRGTWRVLVNALQVYSVVLSAPCALYKTWKVARRTLVALLYPAVYWLCVAVLALVVAMLLARLFGGAFGLLAGVVLWMGWLLEQRLHTSWLLRIFRFADRCAGGQVPDLSARIDGLAEQIRTALLKPDTDEVLLVGFSVGSTGAVAAAARTVRLCEASPQALSRLSVLTLGHCIPLFALMPGAVALRADLALVGANRDLFWVDCSSPSDWGSFALVDPVRLCADASVPVGPSTAHPINPRAMTSPRFHTLFEPGSYARLKKDKRRMHMQYLMSGELPGDYDYFSLTAGAMGLRQRLLQKADS